MPFLLQGRKTQSMSIFKFRKKASNFFFSLESRAENNYLYRQYRSNRAKYFLKRKRKYVNRIIPNIHWLATSHCMEPYTKRTNVTYLTYLKHYHLLVLMSMHSTHTITSDIISGFWSYLSIIVFLGNSYIGARECFTTQGTHVKLRTEHIYGISKTWSNIKQGHSSYATALRLHSRNIY